MGAVTNIFRVTYSLAISGFILSLTGCATSEKTLLERQANAATSSGRRVNGAQEQKFYDAGSELKLDALLAFGVENSPDLRSIYARWRAAESQVPQAAALPDPKLSYGHFVEAFKMKTGEQKQTVGISQTLPWFGKLPLKERIAFKQAESIAREYDAAVLGLVSKIKKSFYDYAWLHDAVQINREHINLLQVVESVASIRFKAGKISQSALVLIQVEQGKIEDRIKELEALKNPLSSSIYAALGVESGKLLPRPARADEVLTDLDTDELKLQLEQTNPELRRLRVLKERQELAVQLADKDYYPDFTFELSAVDTDGGKDPILGLVSINLPIWRRSLDAAKLEAVNQRQSVSQALKHTGLELAAKLDLLVYYYQDALRKNKLYENTLIPKAQQSIELALKEFETGNSGFSELLDAQRTLLEFLLIAKQYSADAYKQLAEIESMVNSSLNEIHGNHAGHRH
ncbi:MAG: TolC family protein [Kiritimatiellae bacterium]|nr:TolC family protein [Kiritimatiellia bacterium]